MDSVAEKLEQSYSGSAEYYSLHWWIRIVYPWCIIAILEKESWFMDFFFLIGRQNVRFGHWQYQWRSLTIPMISFANFDKCLLIWSFYHFILDILPGTWVFVWSGVLGTIGTSSHWYRGVYNSPWIEPVKNEFLFTGGWPNRSLVAGSESLFET